MTSAEQFELDRIERQFAKCGKQTICEDILSEEIMLKMEDGICLRTIIRRPDIEGKVPTIVMRTCYPQNDYIYEATAKEYCKRGFAYIRQYCRGTGGSEGEWEPNVNERADGKTTIDWICNLPWVGNVGYCGCSYLALTGWLIADIVPEKVKTMYLTHYGVFRFISAYQDGMFRHDVLTAWAMENAGFPITADYLESCRFQPQIDVDEKLWGKRIEWYRQWITSTNADDAYWNTGFWNLLKEIPSRVKIPLYVGEGWYDHHLASAIETYRALPEECRNKSEFLIGAWDHEFNVKLQDREGALFENDDILRAFDWFYKLLVEETIPEGKIDTYVIGDDRWYSRREYDIENQKKFKLYLTGKNAEGGYGLSTEWQEKEETVAFVFDPTNPVLTHGAESLLVTKSKQGSLLQFESGYRDDVISFISSELLEDITVLGKIQVKLNVETDAEDTAFVVKVMEVTEEGKAYNMRTGITTLGYRNHSASRQKYIPGEIVEITIDMWDIAWKVKKGSRIRIDITSSDFPQYSVHSNYAGGWALQTQNRKAVQKLHFGGINEAVVIFPCIDF